jgi:hypothetical protein
VTCSKETRPLNSSSSGWYPVSARQPSLTNSIVHCASLRQRYTMPSMFAISVCSMRAVSRASWVPSVLKAAVVAGLALVAMKTSRKSW